MWASQNGTCCAEYAGALLLRSRWNGELIYAYPAGGDTDAALAAIAADAAALGEPLVFASLTEAEADHIQSRLGGTRCTDEGWSDYLYHADALAALAGRAYHAQRNHINRFEAAYPDYAYLPLTTDQLAAVREFYPRQRAAADDGTASGAAEAEATARMLELYPALLAAGAPLCGGVLRVNGAVVGFSIGELYGDTLFVHIEKGDVTYAGVYPMLVRGFARMACTAGASFINREEDDNNPGLRRSKRGYKPMALLPKQMVRV